MKQVAVLFTLLTNLLLFPSCYSQDGLAEPLNSSNYEYLIFGQYSNDQNSRYKQLYRLENDSVYLHFKGGQYYNWSQKKWVDGNNLINLPLTDSTHLSAIPLIKRVPNLIFQLNDSIVGNGDINSKGLFIEIGNDNGKRIWRINRFDHSLTGTTKSIVDLLDEAFNIFDPE